MMGGRYRGNTARTPTIAAEVRMVQSLGFLGVRTDAFDETVALYRDVLG